MVWWGLAVWWLVCGWSWERDLRTVFLQLMFFDGWLMMTRLVYLFVVKKALLIVFSILSDGRLG